eukprot:398666-Prymnesium_polylepis.1
MGLTLDYTRLRTLVSPCGQRGELGRADDAAVHADRHIPAVPVVDHRHCTGAFVQAGVVNNREQPRLSAVNQRVRHSECANIVHVDRQIGGDDEIGDARQQELREH